MLGGLVAAESIAKEVMKEASQLKPGEFTWHPHRQPEGSVAVVVSIPEQLVHVYRNGVRIAVSTCSSGKPGHETPTGVFVVLEKDKHHHSSTYNDASMPNMNRLTWSGIALHAGNLPGYPASHGCVRLPLDFSARLFEVTHIGTPVIIAGSASDPWELVHPGMVLGGYTQAEFKQVEAGLFGRKHPKDWSDSQAHPITSIVVSSVERRAILIENGDVVGEGNVTLDGNGVLGNHFLSSMARMVRHKACTGLQSATVRTTLMWLRRKSAHSSGYKQTMPLFRPCVRDFTPGWFS